MAALALGSVRSEPADQSDSRGAPATREQLRALYRDHHDFVWRNLASLGVPRPAIDDATQDVFLVAHRRWGEFDSQRGSFRAWLYGIVRLAAKSQRRRARLDDPPEDALADGALALDERIARIEAAEWVTRFWDTLDSDKRAVFVAIDIEGLSGPETAEALGINLNTVYSRLRLARTRFETEVARRAARTRREEGRHG